MSRRLLLVPVIVVVASLAAACGEQGPGEQASGDAGLVVSAMTPSEEMPDDLRAAINERAEAIYQVNPEAWDRLTTDDFTVVQPDGRLMRKAERLAELRTQTPATAPAEEQVHIQNYGDVVVRRVRSGDLWVLEVWVRGQRGWQVSVTQLTLAGS